MARRSSVPSVFTPSCPSRSNLCLITGKWAILVLKALKGNTLRFGDLHQRIGGISQKMLAQTLRLMEEKGLVARHVYPAIPVRIEYSLTPLARPLSQPIEHLCRWAEQKSGEVSRAAKKVKIKPEVKTPTHAARPAPPSVKRAGRNRPAGRR